MEVDMPYRFAKAFYKSKTIIANVVLILTGVAGILTDVGLDTTAGSILVGVGALNVVLRWLTDEPIALSDDADA
jgi:hypothetical protein